MSSLLSFAVIILIFVASAAIVLNYADEVVFSQAAGVTLSDAKRVMRQIDDAITQVTAEGAGASRKLRMKSSSIIEVIPEENTIMTQLQLPLSFAQYLTFIADGNERTIAGGGVSCSDAGDIVMENPFLRVVFSKIGSPSSMVAINTSVLLKSATIKPADLRVDFTDSAIKINQSTASINGTGYTELLRKNSNAPSCTTHAYVNGTYEYDAYYTLYSGADFLSVSIRNVARK